ncbi:fatty acid hydroxylase [Pandoraea thiooxydans]|uniref:Fatty acid hydroxylase n=1 Tax=Pandoraea thiooxydans TaxID=445709 RepID=A0A0G3ESN1_9BURK|nr:sterol desaturase family protein [Pandoraea thiooxydans]AKJ68362.1 fatty acid hydroxylase [Pandoraea thiooxydans]APR95705.1 fatty acid hydroxylase [Pandoraea thiooxydans]
MMTERQRKFREQYKADIGPLYNGLLHIAVMYVSGIAAVTYCLKNLQDAGWEWLLVIPVFLAGNFIEWAMHRYVMHRRIDVFALRAIYERHTRQHHQYFTDNEPTIDSTREFRIVFFPWRVLITLGVGGLSLGFVAAKLIDLNAGYIVFLTMVAQYLVYETFHYCCHVHDNWFVRNMPFINTIRRHHTAHHNMGIMMKYNMNLTFPITDWLMGSSDLRRGLLGHLFNGYSEKYVKEELKPVIAKFRVDHSRVTLDGPELTPEEARVMTAP